MNNIYVIGGIGVGKSTFIRKMNSVKANIYTEPIEYWGNLLRLHMNNLTTD